MVDWRARVRRELFGEPDYNAAAVQILARLALIAAVFAVLYVILSPRVDVFCDPGHALQADLTGQSYRCFIR